MFLTINSVVVSCRAGEFELSLKEAVVILNQVIVLIFKIQELKFTLPV
ncbi:MAG: hypothetical protein ACOCWT_01390 [Desulfohalobiaceae bacterium]